MPFRGSIAVFGALCTLLCSLPAPAGAGGSENKKTAALVAEVRRGFTLNGQVIPPEIFRDFGDGNLADSDTIWVTVDLAAAVGSNLYFDPIRQYGDWKIQKKQRQQTDTPEETAYAFKGSTANGLLVAVASYNGGGSGTFHTLHILDVAAGSAFDNDGKRYPRVNLTNIRSVALGDRWEGEVKITGNAVHVTSTGGGPAGGKAGSALTVTAERP
jgi:hypothetical protein